MPTSGLGKAYSPFGAADRLGKLCRDEHADGIEAEIVGIEQDIVGRTGLAETRALPPLGNGEQIANALAPVAAEHRVLDVVVIGRAERRAALQQVVPHDRGGEPAARSAATVVCRRSWNERPAPSSRVRRISAIWMRRSSSGCPGRKSAESTCDSLITMRPPGLTTRANSRSARSVSTMWWRTSPHQSQSAL